ncbi:MAG TPA: hypothetical protein VHM90_03670 [Phycisphaerae bacterium]|nr:hypothetical protein [Phycisphaerae bacterium]
MDGRHYRESLRKMRLFAGEAELTPEKVQDFLQPLIAEWKPVPVPNLKVSPMPTDPSLRLSDATLADLTARIRAIGMNLNKGGQKGIDYHNNFVRKLAMLADTFDCRGWTESAALFDDPETVAEAPVQLAGRVDVLWARNRLPVAVFEVDSTVKARSFQKLKEAASPHKLWVYFGKDLWGFRTFLQKEDPGREVIPVIVPRTFIPSFADGE